jgi:pimeloyl-ACP methyl ester carboxylesterase
MTDIPRTIAVGKGTVAVETAGSGEPVVLLHGWPQTRYAWREVMSALAPHYQAIAVDLPGLGDSSPPPDYRKSTIAGLVWSAVRAVIPDGPVRLVGHDWGGLVGYLCAHAARSEVSRLAVIDVVTPLTSQRTPPASSSPAQDIGYQTSTQPSSAQLCSTSSPDCPAFRRPLTELSICAVIRSSTAQFRSTSETRIERTRTDRFSFRRSGRRRPEPLIGRFTLP